MLCCVVLCCVVLILSSCLVKMIRWLLWMYVKERLLSCLVLSCLVLSCLVLSCLVLPCLVLPCLVYLSTCRYLSVCLSFSNPQHFPRYRVTAQREWCATGSSKRIGMFVCQYSRAVQGYIASAGLYRLRLPGNSQRQRVKFLPPSSLNPLDCNRMKMTSTPFIEERSSCYRMPTGCFNGVRSA